MITVFYFAWYTSYILYYLFINFKKFLIKKKILSKIKFFIKPVYFNKLSVLDKMILVYFYRPNSKIFKIYDLYVIDLFNVNLIRKIKYPLIWQFFLYFNSKPGLSNYLELNFNKTKKFKLYVCRHTNLKNFFFFAFSLFLKKNEKKNFFTFFYFFLLFKLLLKLNSGKSYNFAKVLILNNNKTISSRHHTLLLSMKYFIKNIFNKKIKKNFKNGEALNNANTSLYLDFFLTSLNSSVGLSSKPISMSTRLIVFKKIYFFFKKRLLVTSELNYFWRNSVKEFFSLTKNITLNSTWLASINKMWAVRLRPSTVSKFISNEELDKQIIFYIRKNRIFNKGRYSRNRQLYRTGVYWCIWLSILLGYGLYFTLYRFTINFGYFWWIVFLGLSIFFFNRSVKYRHYSPKYFINDINKNIVWVKTIVYSLVTSKKNFLIFFLNKITFFCKNTFFLKNNNLYLIFFLNFFEKKTFLNFFEDYLFINFSKEL